MHWSLAVQDAPGGSLARVVGVRVSNCVVMMCVVEAAGVGALNCMA